MWAIIAAVIAVAASAGVYYQQRKMEAQAKKQAQEAKAVQISGHDSNRGLYTVYGKALIGSTTVWKKVSDKQTRMTQTGFTTFSRGTGDLINGTRDLKSNRFLYRAVSLCAGPIQSVENILIDDEGYQSSRFGQGDDRHFAAAVSLGPTAGQNFSAMRTSYSDFNAWGTSFTGKGVAYAIERLYLDNDKPAYQGEPSTKYLVKGRKLYDPRKDSTSSVYDATLGTSSHRFATPTTWEWSDNPVLALLDYMTNSEYGRGLALSVIDLPSIAEAADKCDELVDVPARLTNTTGSSYDFYDPESGQVITVPVNTNIPNYRPEQGSSSQQKRFRINIAIDPSKELLDNIQEILNVFRGNLSYANGKYRVHMADVASPVLTIGDDDIITGLKISNGDRSQRMNRATVKFINANKQHKTDQASWPSLDSNEDDGLYDTYLTEDQGERLHKTFTIKGCTDFYQAQDTAEFLVRDSRSNLTVAGTFGSRCFGLVPGDVVSLTYDSAGYSGKYFRVMQVAIDLNSMNVNLQLKEYDSSVYTWNDARGNEPEGLTWQEEVVNASPTTPVIGTLSSTTRTRADGSTALTLTIPFSNIPEQAQYVDVEWGINGTDRYNSQVVFDTENINQVEVPIEQDNTTYAVRVRYFITDSAGTLMSSNFATDTITVGTLTGTKLEGIEEGATANTGALADLDTVDTDQIEDNAVTIAKVADTLQSTNYSAGSAGWKLTTDGTFEAGDGTFRGAITATSLTLDNSVAIDGGNLPIDIYASVDATTVNKDPYFANRVGDFWFSSSGGSSPIDTDSEFTFKTDGTGLPTGRSTYLQAVSNDNGSDNFFSESFDLESGKAYRITVWVQQPSGAKKNYLLVGFKDSNGNNINNSSSPVSDGQNWPFGIGTYHYYGISNSAFPTSWTKYEVVFGGNASIQPPTNAVQFFVGALTLRDVAGSTTTINWAQYHVEEIDSAATNASVTSIGGVTVTGSELYQGTGTFNNANTGFYLDSSGQFSLKDKLSFNGTTLAVDGNVTAQSLTLASSVEIGAGNIAYDDVTLTNSGGNLVIKAGGVDTTQLADGAVSNEKLGSGSVSLSNIIEGSVSKVNPVTQTGNIYRWAGYDDAGNVVNEVPSGITVEYDTTEKALELRCDGNVGMRSDTFKIDHNSIYKITFQIKKDAAVGNWYVGAYQLTSATTGFVSDGGNVQSSANFTIYNATTRASSSTSNAYFWSQNATTSYEEFTAYLLGSNVDINEVPAQTTTIIQVADGYDHVGLRILNWNNAGTTTSLFIKHLSVVEMTATTIIADNISTTNLAAISSDLGAITAGSLNINNAFTVSSAGAMTATGADVSGAITATSLTLSGTSIAESQLAQGVQDSLALADSASQVNRGLALLLNQTTGGTSNSGEASLVGVDKDGNPETGTDGFIIWNGDKITVERNQYGGSYSILTNAASKTGFIVFDVNKTQPFSDVGTTGNDTDVAFVWKIGSQWYYDANNNGNTFTPSSVTGNRTGTDGTTTPRLVALGYMQTGSADTIIKGGLFGEPVDLELASFPTDVIQSGSVGGVTITDTKLYQGTGTHNNTNTGFYLDSSGNFSLKDKLSFDGTTLSVDGNVTVDEFVKAGSGSTAAVMSGRAADNFAFWAGADFDANGGASGANAPFRVTRAGKVIMTNFALYSTTGQKLFDSTDGLLGLPSTQVAASTGSLVSSVSDELASGTDYATIQLSSAQTITVDFDYPLNYLFASGTSEANAYGQIATSITVTIQKSTDASTWSTLGSVTFDKTDSSSASTSQYYVQKQTVYLGSEFGGGTLYFASLQPGGAVDDGNVLNGTVSASLATGTHYLRMQVTYGGSGLAAGGIPSTTAARSITLTTSGAGFTVDSSGNVSDGVSTSATTGWVTSNFLAKDSSGNVTVPGNLTVQGDTVQLNTATLNVEDKNIILNYAAGDTSGSADGAGITIQDAVNANTDASLTWNATNDVFVFSHGVNFNGALTGNGVNTYLTGDGVHLVTGSAGGGKTAVVGNTMSKASGPSLDYKAYFSYDAYYDEDAFLWKAKRTTLGRKWLMQMGYHTNEYRLRFYDGGGSGSVANGWADSDWTDVVKITYQGNATFLGAIYPSNQSTNYIDSTRISNWQTAYGWGNHASAGYLTSSDLSSYVTTAGANFTNTLGIHKTNPVITINDTNATNATNQIGYISFQRSGTEKAWIGYGSGTNADFTIRNTEGPVTISGGLAVTNGTFEPDSLVVSGRHISKFNETGRFYLGNNDWTDLISMVSGADNSAYSATHQGVTMSGAGKWFQIKTQIPIDPSASYRIKVRVKHVTTVSGSGRFYGAVNTLNEDLTNLSSDTATSYNYGLASGAQLTAGQTYTFESIFSGYNATNTGATTKFDPEGKYFNLLFITNYQGDGTTCIQSVEIERISDEIYIGANKVINSDRDLVNIVDISSGGLATSGNKVALAGTSFTNMTNNTSVSIGGAWMSSSASLFVNGFSRYNGNLYISDGGDTNYVGIGYSNGKVTAVGGNGNGINAFDGPAGYYVGNTQLVDALLQIHNVPELNIEDTSNRGFTLSINGDGTTSSVGHTAANNEGIFWHTNTTDYGIYRTAGAWTASTYQQLKLKWLTGIVLDGGTQYDKSAVNIENSDLQMSGNAAITNSRFFVQSEAVYPNVVWGASGSTTGMVAIRLPVSATSGSPTWDMANIEITVYEYNSTAGSKIFIAGHQWYGTSYGWPNSNVQVIGGFNKPIYLAKSADYFWILLGNTDSAWSYGSVHVNRVDTSTYYNNEDWLDGWNISQVTTDPSTAKTGDLNANSAVTLKTNGYVDSYGVNATRGQFNNSNNFPDGTTPDISTTKIYASTKVVTPKLVFFNDADGDDNYITCNDANNTTTVNGNQSGAWYEFYGDKTAHHAGIVTNYFKGAQIELSSTMNAGSYQVGGTEVISSGRAISAKNATFDNGTSTTVNIISDDTGESVLNIYGATQGTGRLFVGQQLSYGGGIEYNGDDSPASTGAGADYTALYRKAAGTLYWTARNQVNSSDWEFAGAITANGEVASRELTRTPSRVNHSRRYPVGHYSQGECVFEIDPTWSEPELQDYFGNTGVTWTADSTAPAGYAIRIDGSIQVGGVYNSGFPYIPVEENDEFYMEVWIKNVGTNQTHYMGSNEFNENFASLGGNPGSYGYWVMSNANPTTTWTKYSGYIGGFHASNTGDFEVGTKYWTPLALFNYGAGTGTRACVISGWRVIRTKMAGRRIFTDPVSFGRAGAGQSTYGRWLSIDGSAQTDGEGSARIFFAEHNSTTGGMDNYGMSLGYRGGATSIPTSSGNNWAGLSQIDNGQWGMWGHNNSGDGSLIMFGDRAATFVDFADNNIRGVSDFYSTNNNIAMRFSDASYNMFANKNGAWRVYIGENDTYIDGNTLHFRNSGGGTDKLSLSTTQMTTNLQLVAYSDSSHVFRTSTNGVGVSLAFSDHAGGSYGQQGYINYYHADGSSYGGGNAFVLSSTESVLNLVVNGGNMIATGNVTAYYSDERLKTFHGRIDSALNKVMAIGGYYFTENEKAKSLGYTNDKMQVGVNAQEVQKIMPEVVEIAPISYTDKADVEYLTVDYGKLVPLLIEAVKEQQDQIEQLKSLIEEMKNGNHKNH